MIVIDQINRKLTIKNTPKRIICLVPSITELLFDLGLGNSIVGVTKFCVHPDQAKKTKTIVGGTKNIRIEKIKRLNPDIILCNKEENTEEIVYECSKITITHVSDIVTLEDALKLIREYGLIFNCQSKSELILDNIHLKKNEFLVSIVNKPKIKVAYFIWKNPWMAVANHTFIHHLLELNKFENIYANKLRYPEVKLENMYDEGDPELILLSSEPYPFQKKHAKEIEKTTGFTKIIFVDGEMFSWYCSRLIKAFDYFKTLRERI